MKFSDLDRRPKVEGTYLEFAGGGCVEPPGGVKTLGEGLGWRSGRTLFSFAGGTNGSWRRSPSKSRPALLSWLSMGL